MNSYLFLGRVLPERMSLTIPKTVFRDLISPNAPSKMIGDLTVEAVNGQLTVNLVTSQTFYLATIKNSVEFYIRVIIDSFGYCAGQAFDVDIELVSCPGEVYIFYPRVNSIYNNQTKRPLPPEEVLKIAAKNMSLLRALGNLREAIKHPVDVGLFCFRAIENIRQHFVKPGISKSQSWTIMHQALNISTQFIDNQPSLTVYSEQSRHGETQDIIDQDMEEMLNKTWKIVDRFCVYLKNNGTGLNLNLYPQL